MFDRVDVQTLKQSQSSDLLRSTHNLKKNLPHGFDIYLLSKTADLSKS